MQQYYVGREQAPCCPAYDISALLSPFAAGEAGGLRIPRAGLAPSGRPAWLTQSALFLSERPNLAHRGAAADEAGPPPTEGGPGMRTAAPVLLMRLTGADALDMAAGLRRIRGEERIVRSSLDALSAPRPTGAPFISLFFSFYWRLASSM